MPIKEGCKGENVSFMPCDNCGYFKGDEDCKEFMKENGTYITNEFYSHNKKVKEINLSKIEGSLKIKTLCECGEEIEFSTNINTKCKCGRNYFFVISAICEEEI